MLVVLTVFSFLLASVSLAIGTLFRAQGELQDELAQANIARRLAAQLRADAHLSTSAEVVDEGDTNNLRLLLPNASIHYATHPRRIIRTVAEGDTETHREVFSLLEGTTARWGLTSETPAFITLTISYRSPELREGVARPREHRVETSIGLHSGGVK
jgi:type II secretory pathway pseudopilin PulG